MEDVMLLYASNRRLEGWGSLDVGGPVELFVWRSVSPMETAPMWVSPTHPTPTNLIFSKTKIIFQFPTKKKTKQ
jgi:hypothetical protein